MFFIQALKQAGVQAGDRIALRLAHDPKLADLLFAIWELGACACPLNPKLPEAVQTKYIQRLDPSLVIDSFERFGSSVRKPGKSPDLLLFTSGSTGKPKIAALSLDNLHFSAKGALQTLDLQKDDEWLLQLPLYHVGGIGVLFRCLAAKAKAVFHPSPNITHLSAVPTQLYRASPVYPKLRCLLVGGAPVTQLNPHLPVYVTYGLTEMSSLVVARKHPPKIEGHFYLGNPLPGREVLLSEEGEILVRGACLFQGYWEGGISTTPPEWFATGDIGKWHPKEGLAIVGRKDWQFISGGENIQPEEIEAHLKQIPGIEEAVVVPVDDPEFGARPAAVVQGPLTLKTMQTFLENRLPKYKVPIAVWSVEKLPKKDLKIDRKAIFRFVSDFRPAS